MDLNGNVTSTKLKKLTRLLQYEWAGLLSQLTTLKLDMYEVFKHRQQLMYLKNLTFLKFNIVQSKRIERL